MLHTCCFFKNAKWLFISNLILKTYLKFAQVISQICCITIVGKSPSKIIFICAAGKAYHIIGHEFDMVMQFDLITLCYYQVKSYRNE